jgi:hypothetical protein
MLVFVSLLMMHAVVFVFQLSVPGDSCKLKMDVWMPFSR